MCCVPYKYTIYYQMKISSCNVVIDHLANELVQVESCSTTCVSFKNRIAMDNVHVDKTTNESFLKVSFKILSLLLNPMIDIIELKLTTAIHFLNYTFEHDIYLYYEYPGTPHDK